MSKMLAKMNLISAVQQLPSEDIETIQGYVEMLEKENEELKKQQQEFIKYLEVERERCLTFYCRTECAYAYDVFKGVLAKYKSIIGVKDENNL